jgi:hypothetical protein
MIKQEKNGKEEKKMIDTKIKIRFPGVCCAHGSSMRSGKCPFEVGYVEFETGLDFPRNGRVRWYNEEHMWDFSDGQCYRFEAWVTPDATIQRPKILR